MPKCQNSENSNSQIQKNPKVPSSKSDLFFKIGTNGIWKKLKNRKRSVTVRDRRDGI